MKSLVLTALASALMVAPAAAQTPLAVISGTVNGEPRQWYVLEQSGLPSADWRAENGSATMRILGYPEPHGPLTSDGHRRGDTPQGALTIDILFMGSGTRRRAFDISARLEGARGVHRNDPMMEIGTTRFVIEEERIEGDLLHVTGRLEADLYGAQVGRRTLDLDDHKALTADIALTLAPAPVVPPSP